MDFIRCFALLNVVSIHFPLNVGFYNEIVSGWLMYLMVVFRTFTQCCVPLFLLLSGYLMRTRQPTRKYYSKIIKTVGIYILSSLFCLLYRYIFLHESASLIGSVLDILCYAAAPYSWYIEMYLGLFLIIPFLNILYNNIGSKKEKQLLLLVFLILTALPSVMNIYRVADFGWWLHPSSSGGYTQIVPQWWIGIYPITYYFIGCYLSEYPIKIRIGWCGLAVLMVTFAAGTFGFYRSYGSRYIWGEWQEWPSLLVVIQSVLLFALFSNMNFNRLGSRTKSLLAKLSDWCLAAYLVSWIFEGFCYLVLERLQPNVQNRFFFMPIVVFTVYVCSLGLSAMINLIYQGVEKLFTRLIKGTRKNEKTVSQQT